MTTPQKTLPSGWAWAPVEELGEPNEQSVLTGPFGTNLTKEHFTTSGVPVLTIGCLTETGIDLHKSMYVQEETALELERYRLRTGDFLFSRMASVGRASLVPEPLTGALFNYHIMRLRLSDRAYEPNLFLAYVRGAPVVKDYLKQVNHGGTRDGINTTQLLQMPVAVPPRAEQRRIAAKLDALLARSRRAKEALEAIPALLEKFRQSVLAAAFRGDLTADWRAQHPDVEPASKLLERIRAERRRRWEKTQLEKMLQKGKPPRDDSWKASYPEPGDVGSTPTTQLPDGWSWASVEQLLVEPLCNGISVAGSDAPPGIPALKLSAMGSGDFNYREQRYLPLEWSDVADLEIKPRDFFVSRGNGSLSLVGRGTEALNPPSGIIFPDTMIRLRFSSDLTSSSWPSMIWSAPGVRQQIEQRVKTTAGIWKIAQTQLASIELPIPPLAEQCAITARLRQHLQAAANVESFLVGALKRHSDLESALLAKAFRGELVPQDPNDEPASVLLERLRAERAASAEAAPKRSRAARASASRPGPPAESPGK